MKLGAIDFKSFIEMIYILFGLSNIIVQRMYILFELNMLYITFFFSLNASMVAIEDLKILYLTR